MNRGHRPTPDGSAPPRPTVAPADHRPVGRPPPGHQRVDAAGPVTAPPPPPSPTAPPGPGSFDAPPPPTVAPTVRPPPARRADGGTGSTVHHRDPSRVRARTGGPPGSSRTCPPGTGRTAPRHRHRPHRPHRHRPRRRRPPPPPPPPPPATGTAAAAAGTAAWTGAPSPATTGRGGQPPDPGRSRRSWPRPRSRGGGASPRPPPRRPRPRRRRVPWLRHGCRRTLRRNRRSDPPANPVPLTSVTLPPPPPQGTGAPGTPGAVVWQPPIDPATGEALWDQVPAPSDTPPKKAKGPAPGGEGHRRRCRRLPPVPLVPLVR